MRMTIEFMAPIRELKFVFPSYEPVFTTETSGHGGKGFHSRIGSLCELRELCGKNQVIQETYG